MRGVSSHSSRGEADRRRAEWRHGPCRKDCGGSVVGVVPLQILAVQLLLGFVELPQLLGLAFAQLLPFCVVRGETLQCEEGREGGREG